MEDSYNDFFANDPIESLISRYETMLEKRVSRFFDVDDFLDIASYYLDHFEFNKAFKAITIALSQHPLSSEILLMKANVLFHQENYKQASKQLSEIEYLESSNPEFHFLQGHIYVGLKNIHMALKAYSRCLSLAEDDRYDFVENIATHLVNNEYYEEALPFLEAGFEKEKFQYGAIYDLLTVYEKLELNTKLYRFLLDAIEDDPFDALFWTKLGDYYKEKQQVSKALDAYQYAVAINDSLVTVYEKIASCLKTEKKYKKALRYYEYLMKKEPQNANYVLEAAYCEYYLNRYDEAAFWAEQALDLLTDDSKFEAYELLVSICEEKGQFEKAIQWLDSALKEIQSEDSLFVENDKTAEYIGEKIRLLDLLGRQGKILEMLEDWCFTHKFMKNVSPVSENEDVCMRYIEYLLDNVFVNEVKTITTELLIPADIFKKRVYDFIQDLFSENGEYWSRFSKEGIQVVYKSIAELVFSFIPKKQENI